MPVSRLDNNLVDVEHEALPRPLKDASAAANWGPAAWKRLHLRMIQCGKTEPANQHEVLAWLKAFGLKLPCGECAKEWCEILRKNTATLLETKTPGLDLFAWSVDVHNQINRKLGKPEMTHAAAKAIYGDPGTLAESKPTEAGHPKVQPPAPAVAPAAKSAPPQAWPQWAQTLAKLATAGDRGLGDTAQRYAAKAGGEWFKKFMKSIGLNCGCKNRQQWLNARFPLPQ